MQPSAGFRRIEGASLTSCHCACLGKGEGQEAVAGGLRSWLRRAAPVELTRREGDRTHVVDRE